MSISVILLLVAAGVLILPSFGGDDDEDENTNNRNQIQGGPENDTLNGTAGADLDSRLSWQRHNFRQRRLG